MSAIDFARMARGSALRERPSPSRPDAWSRLFDAVQAIATEQEVAGDFEEWSARSTHEGPWDWRAYIAEELDAPRDESIGPRSALVGYD